MTSLQNDPPQEPGQSPQPSNVPDASLEHAALPPREEPTPSQQTTTAPQTETPVMRGMRIATKIEEHKLTAAGFDVADIANRFNLDGATATDKPEVFNIIMLYVARGVMHDDGHGRPIVGIGLAKEFQIADAWVGIARQLDIKDATPENAHDLVKQWIVEESEGQELCRGNEPLHIALQIDPTLALLADARTEDQSLVDAAQRFLNSYNVLLEQLDKMNENYELTISIYSPVLDRFLPEGMKDIAIERPIRKPN